MNNVKAQIKHDNMIVGGKSYPLYSTIIKIKPKKYCLETFVCNGTIAGKRNFRTLREALLTLRGIHQVYLLTLNVLKLEGEKNNKKWKELAIAKDMLETAKHFYKRF